ncbi:MAG: hypothetical protein ACJATV_000663 [Granulosicoccus sp.]|jgi:hypothetical protein
MLKKTYLLMILCLFTSYIQAQDTQQNADNTQARTAYDCTIVALESGAGEILTKAERIAKMDNSLLDSIDKHDQCVEQVVTNNAAAASGGVAAGGAEESEAEGEESSTGNGNESEANTSSATEQANSERETNNSEYDSEPSNNGAKDQRIDPKDNDSAVCRLLKDELKIEKDSKKQNELKEIYNNYDCRG